MFVEFGEVGEWEHYLPFLAKKRSIPMIMVCMASMMPGDRKSMTDAPPGCLRFPAGNPLCFVLSDKFHYGSYQEYC